MNGFNSGSQAENGLKLEIPVNYNLPTNELAEGMFTTAPL
jgi:hypothetical protein